MRKVYKRSYKEIILVLLLIVSMISVSIPTIGSSAAQREPNVGIRTYDLPEAVVEQPYNVQLLVFSDEGYTHNVIFLGSVGLGEETPSTIPAGLTLNNDGTITGVPTETGSTSFSIEVSWVDSSTNIVKTKTIGWFYLRVASSTETITVSSTAPVAPFRTDISISANSGEKMYKFVAPSHFVTIRETYTSPRTQLYRGDGTKVMGEGLSFPLGQVDCFYKTTVGNTYYLVVENSDSQKTIQILPYVQETSTGEGGSSVADKSLTKISSNITKTFANETNTQWDIWSLQYVIDNDFDVSYCWIYGRGSTSIVADYKAYFGELTVNAGWGEPVLDYISYDEPSQNATAIELKAGEQLSYIGYYYALPFYGAHIDDIVTSSREIYVPAGSDLFIDDRGIIRDKKQTAQISTNVRTLTDENTGVSVTGDIPEGATLSVELVQNGETFALVKNALASMAERFFAYDISLQKDGEKIQPNGKVKVTVPIPNGYDYRRSVIYYVNKEGVPTKLYSTLDSKNATLIFEVDHFSLYAVAEESSSPNTGENSMTIYSIIFAFLAISLVVLVRRRFLVCKSIGA